MIDAYLLDASAYWRFRRDLQTWAAWSLEITEGEVCVCEAKVLRSGRSPAERRQMRKLLGTAFTAAPTSKDPGHGSTQPRNGSPH